MSEENDQIISVQGLTTRFGDHESNGKAGKAHDNPNGVSPAVEAEAGAISVGKAQYFDRQHWKYAGH